jgi:hypothetical protein
MLMKRMTQLGMKLLLIVLLVKKRYVHSVDIALITYAYSCML